MIDICGEWEAGVRVPSESRFRLPANARLRQAGPRLSSYYPQHPSEDAQAGFYHMVDYIVDHPPS